ncbi:MAG: tetratricopeptide repeat protein [Acidobacteria bacterium]|nr:tetratricopeptide repeat protein [Acidobacteriota bacterium]
MRWLALLTLPIAAAEPGYVDPSTCQPCHARIYASYMRTGMGRSFRAEPVIPPSSGYRHEASGESYSLVKREGETMLHREPYGFERSITHAVGSGNHSQTFLHRTAAGKLIELPLSWYAEKGGMWRMSPGYDRPDHSGFRREVTDSCLFCHNGYPSQANSGLANGIDCQRCHGPGARHAVNPAKLGAERRLEVCLQCHLESASGTLPDAVRTPGRGVFSYRPGERLSDYITYFEFAAPADDRITVNGAGYGMLKSACFQKSGGRLTCTSCHNPHEQNTDAPHFTQVCRSCHAGSHEPARANCTGCHMQKRRTEDAVHVVMTDHRIRRRPFATDQTAPIAERHDRMTGPVRLLYPPQLPDTPAARLSLAMAQRDIQSLEAAKPSNSEVWIVLAEAYKQAGRATDAIRAYRNGGALVAAAELMMARGESVAAIQLLEPAPNDAKVLNALAILYVDQNRSADALKLMYRAIELEPDDPASWLNLGVCREATGDRTGAAAAYQMSLRLQPDLARARQFLQRVTRP